MKRLRAFILSEQLMTIMLQASFIIVLCASFYQLISFYTRTQQVLTARNHAERVISFMDEKIRNAGLGLWRCDSSSVIRGKLGSKISMLWTFEGNPSRGYKLPVALQRGFKDNKTPQNAKDNNYIPSLKFAQDSGDIVTVLYAVRDLSSGSNYQAILHTATPLTLKRSGSNYQGDLPILDKSTKNHSLFKSPVLGNTANNENNIRSYVVMESYGYPAYLFSTNQMRTHIVRVYNLTNPSQEEITIPAASELLGLNCMQMLVHDNKDGQGRQFAYRELTDGGSTWNGTYNQEKGILEIYMEVDRGKNIFTLWVLASGGYDASMNNPRPDSWPKEANPQGKTDSAAKTAWLNSDYRHHIVYVSRAQWKLNNIPQGFIWD